jgi:hypothetical protein
MEWGIELTMAMPWQLKEGLRQHPKGSRPPRPIAEQLPSVSVNDLHISSLDTSKTYTMPNVSLRYPFLSSVRLSIHAVEFQLPSLHRSQPGPTQTFKLKHIRTGYGIRHAFICTCQRPVIKLYYLHRKLACRRCCGSIYASQTIDQRTRPVLQASRIESFFENKELLLYKQTRERLKKKFGEKVMMAQGSMGTKARSLWK